MQGSDMEDMEEKEGELTTEQAEADVKDLFIRNVSIF